jgi:hypothetical protein
MYINNKIIKNESKKLFWPVEGDSLSGRRCDGAFLLLLL